MYHTEEHSVDLGNFNNPPKVTNLRYIVRQFDYCSHVMKIWTAVLWCEWRLAYVSLYKFLITDVLIGHGDGIAEQ